MQLANGVDTEGTLTSATQINTYTFVVAEPGSANISFKHEPLTIKKGEWRVTLKNGTGSGLSLTTPIGLPAGN